jgi:AcrR family transcriptional regulator
MTPELASSTPRAERLGPVRRRPLILDAALHLLVTEGTGDVSMDAIAAAAGVTKPVVYSCFSSKAELWQALIEREEQRMLAHVGGALPERPNLDDPEAGLRAGLTAFLSAVAAEPDSWRLIYLAERGGEPEIRRRVARGRELQLQALRGLTTAQFAARGDEDAERKGELLARTIVSTAEMAARLTLEAPERWSPQDLAEMLARVVVRGAIRI